MKKIITVIFAISTLLSFSQAPTFQWAKQFGSSVNDIGNSISLDAGGNVYTTGEFSFMVDFDPGAGVFNLSSAGAKDIFISKLDNSGNFVWAQRIGGTSDDVGTSIYIDAVGNIYLTGEFQGSVDFDPGVGTFSLTSLGANDAFVLKLNSSGNFLWAKQLGGTSAQSGASIKVDAAGNVYSTGNFYATADFDPNGPVFNLTSSGFSDIYISKLDASGNFIWAQKLGGTNYDNVTSISIDNSGNVLTTGNFEGISDFDPGVGVFTLSVVQSKEIFISKLSSGGAFVWAKQIGNSANAAYDDIGYSITSDANGNVLTTGTFYGTVDFDPGPGTYTVPGQANDVFVLKLNSSGNFVWAKQFTGTASDQGFSIFLDSYENIYTSGTFGSTVDFDPGPGVFNLNAVSSYRFFISKLDNSGNFNWALMVGDATYDSRALSVVADNSGSVYSTGYFKGTSDFDPSVGIFNLINSPSNTSDVFVYKLAGCSAPSVPTNTTPLSNQTICNNNTTNLMAISSGSVTWYATPTSTTALGTGTNYTTPSLTVGTYTYYAQAATCTISVSRTPITVTVNPSPTITVNSGSICSGNSYTMNASGANTYTYQGGNAVVSPTSTTSYTVVGTNTLGCASNIATSNVTVNPNPTVTAVSNTSLLCVGQSATLTASGASTYTFNPGGSGANITVSPTVTTTYTITGTNTFGCQNTTSFTQSVSACTGINTNANVKLSGFELYPNPTSAILTIELNTINESTTIALYNSIGQLLTKENLITTKRTIDLNNLANGIYFVKVQNENQFTIKKIIKQ